MINVDDLMHKFASARAKFSQSAVPPITQQEVERSIGRPLAPGEGVQSAVTHPLSLAARQDNGGTVQPFNVVDTGYGATNFAKNLLPSVVNPHVEGSVASGGPATIGDMFLGGAAGSALGNYYLNPNVRLARSPASYPPGTPVNQRTLANMNPAAASAMVASYIPHGPGAISLNRSISGPLAVQANAPKNQAAPTRQVIGDAIVRLAKTHGVSAPGAATQGERATVVTEPSTGKDAPKGIRALQSMLARGREQTPLPAGGENASQGTFPQRARTGMRITPPATGLGRHGRLFGALAGAAVPLLYNKLIGSQHTVFDPNNPQGITRTSFFPAPVSTTGEVKKDAPSSWNPLNWFR